MNKGLNMQLVKSENRSLILYLLNREGSLSRKELSARLGLTPAAVTKICTGLIDAGFIRESGESAPQGKSGRREILLSLCLDDKAVLGINAEKDCVTLSVSRLDGMLIKSEQIAFSENVDDIIANAKRFKEQNEKGLNHIKTIMV